MRAIHFLYEEQQLDEVAMNPMALKTMASKVGATAGMEFEMIVPDMSSPEDAEQENDMSSDERASSWGGIEDFFMGGNDMNSRSDVRTMIQSLQEDFHDWVNEVIYERWRDGDGRNYFDNYVDDEFDEESAREEAEAEISAANPNLPSDSEDYEKLILQRAGEKKQEWLDEQWEDEGRSYDRALEQFEEDERDSIDEGDWLESNYRWMSDIWENFGNRNDVYWPYTTSSSDNSDFNELAEDYSSAIGRGVNASAEYHGVRNEGEYTIEPDGSLDADDSDDTGLEFVSPPLPLEEMIKDLAKTIQWAKSRGCYTNNSTGLHMNVSVPNFSREKLDYVKLALLMGDEYVLKEFGRTANSYTRSAMGKIRERVPSDPEVARNLLQQAKNGLLKTASNAIHSGQTDKYTSINTKTGYIEFRSPGGNWLDEDLDKLVSTLNRFVVALDAACDPEKYKKDYLKKLYAVLQPKSSGDPIAYFAQYAAGELTKQGLSSMIRTFRGKPAPEVTQEPQGLNLYKIFSASGTLIAGDEYGSDQEALQRAQYWARQRSMDVVVINQQGQQIGRVSSYGEIFPTAQQPQSAQQTQQEPNFYIVDGNTNQIVDRYYAPDSNVAHQYLGQWRQQHDPQETGNYRYGRLSSETEERYRNLAATQPVRQTVTGQQGNWGIWVGGANRFAREPGEYPGQQEIPLRRFNSQEDAELFLQRMRDDNPRIRTDVEVREIPQQT
mgnify:CR=1 FL=1